MEDKKPSARKTYPKQVDQRKKQAFSKQPHAKKTDQVTETTTYEPDAIPGFEPRATAKPASGHSDSRRMPKDHVVKDTVRHAQAVVEKVRDEVNEQTDVSPGQYAEQKVESYTGTVLHKTESALESAGTALRKRAIRQFQEKREEERMTDRERSTADAEIRREETVETDQPGYTTDRPASELPRTDHGIGPVTESGQPDTQARENAKKHLTYRDRSIDQQTMEPVDRNPSTGSSISEEGGRAHAQGQTKRSEWQKNASGLRVQDPYGRAPSASVSKAEDRAVSPAKSILPGTEKEAHIAAAAPEKAVKGTRKTLDAGRTAQQTTRTVQQTAKTAQKAAQTSAKAARAAKETTQRTAKATAKAAQAAAKALAAAIKAIIEGIKALIVAIVGGGWMAILVIVLIAAVLSLLISSFGLFFSNDVTEDRPMTEAIAEINGDFVSSIDAKIERYKRRYKPDEVILVYEGDTDSNGSVMNWQDVLGIYAVSTTTDPENPTDVLTVSRDKIETLRSTFKRMNSVSYETELETEEIPSVDGHGDPIFDDEGNTVMEVKKTLTVTVTVLSMDNRDAAALYNFSDVQMEMLREMMRPEYYPLYASLTGDVIGDGGECGFGLDINPDLPPNELGYQIVQAAKRYIGRSYASMDCSTLCRTAYRDCGLNSMNGLSSVRMAEKCKEMGCLFTDASQLQAGDLIFFASLDPSRGKDYCRDRRRCGDGKCRRWLHIHHVAIYINDQYLIDSTGGDNSVQIRKLYGQNSSTLKWVCFGRPTT